MRIVTHGVDCVCVSVGVRLNVHAFVCNVAIVCVSCCKYEKAHAHMTLKIRTRVNISGILMCGYKVKWQIVRVAEIHKLRHPL